MPRTRSTGERWSESSSVTHPADAIKVFPVYFPVAVTLTAMKAIIHASDSGDVAKFVIYDDSSGPNNLVLESSEHSFGAIASQTTVTVWSGTQNLSAGKYWIGLHVGNTTVTPGIAFDNPSDGWYLSTSYAGGAPDPWSGGNQSSSNVVYPHDYWVEWEEQSDTDGDTIEGTPAGTGTPGWVGGTNEIDLRQFTVPADGDINKVLVDFGHVVTWGNNKVKPCIYDDNADSPNNLLAAGPEVDMAFGMYELALTSALAVTSGDKIWVGYIQDNRVDMASAGTSQRCAYATGTYASGPPDPISSPNVSTGRDMPIGYSLSTGGGTPVGGGGQSFRIMVGM